jgi:hypothetical protein
VGYRGPGEGVSLEGTVGSPDELVSPFSGERAACWLFALVIERSVPGRAAVGYSSMRAAHLGAPLLVDTVRGRVLLPPFSYTLQLAVQPLQRPRRVVVYPVDPSRLFLIGDPWTRHDRPLTPELRELLASPAAGALSCHEQGLGHGARVSLSAVLQPRPARGAQGYRGDEDAFPGVTLEADPQRAPVMLTELPLPAIERLRLLLRKLRALRSA